MLSGNSSGPNKYRSRYIWKMEKEPRLGLPMIKNKQKLFTCGWCLPDLGSIVGIEWNPYLDGKRRVKNTDSSSDSSPLVHHFSGEAQCSHPLAPEFLRLITLLLARELIRNPLTKTNPFQHQTPTHMQPSAPQESYIRQCTKTFVPVSSTAILTVSKYNIKGIHWVIQIANPYEINDTVVRRHGRRIFAHF